MMDLGKAEPYNEIVQRYELTALFHAGDLQVERGDLALTKDGDLKFGVTPYNAMFRSVEAWRLNAPAMQTMFKTIKELKLANSVLEVDRDKLFRGQSGFGAMIRNNTVKQYHMINDALGATIISRTALAGSLLIVMGSLLGRFRDDGDFTWKNWNSAAPHYGGCSLGQVVIAGANSFRHADEWVKTRFAGKQPTTEQLRSMNVIRAARGLPTESNAHYDAFDPEIILDLISDDSFDLLAKAALQFANFLTCQALATNP